MNGKILKKIIFNTFTAIILSLFITLFIQDKISLTWLISVLGVILFFWWIFLLGELYYLRKILQGELEASFEKIVNLIQCSEKTIHLLPFSEKFIQDKIIRDTYFEAKNLSMDRGREELSNLCLEYIYEGAIMTSLITAILSVPYYQGDLISFRSNLQKMTSLISQKKNPLPTKGSTESFRDCYQSYLFDIFFYKVIGLLKLEDGSGKKSDQAASLIIKNSYWHSPSFYKNLVNTLLSK